MDPSGQTGLAAESAAPYRLIALSPYRLIALSPCRLVALSPQSARFGVWERRMRCRLRSAFMHQVRRRKNYVDNGV